MIRWPEIAPLLLDLFTELAADQTRSTEGFGAEWKEGTRSAVHQDQGFSLLLKCTNVRGVGRDEQRLEDVPEDSLEPEDEPFLGQLRVAQVGHRRFTIQVQAHCIERTDELFAMVPLDRIRIGLRHPATLARLLEYEVSLVDVLDSVKANYRDGKRVISAASMDCIFYAAFTLTDPGPTGWLERIEYTSHVQETEGIDIPVPPNVVDHLSPPID